MEKAKLTLVGLRHGISKEKKKPYCALFISRPFNEKENENGAYGCEIRTEWAPEHQVDTFKAEDIGKEVELVYDFNAYGRPYISEIQIVK